MRPSTITIVASGWSAAKVDFRALPGSVIGVNEPSVLLPSCEYAVTMDRLWFEARAEILRRKATEASHNALYQVYVRDAAAKNFHDTPNWLRRFMCDYKSPVFSEGFGRLNGTNSGYCALNLAYLMRPDTVYLVGFDMNLSPDGAAYWHPRHTWATKKRVTGRYADWAKEFEIAATLFKRRSIKVFNVSETSAITAFEKIAPSRLKEVATADA